MRFLDKWIFAYIYSWRYSRKVLIGFLIILYPLALRFTSLRVVLAFIVSAPTFGSVYRTCGEYMDCYLYDKIAYRYFGLKPDAYYDTLFGKVFVTVVTGLGYFLGVKLATDYTLILTVLTIIAGFIWITVLETNKKKVGFIHE